ncbi:hypothetical protein [[Roseibacterium] beibuensis]|uniref:hypothetical protein n=1 Tax=[Roseibacterium] beibuensis TaxID=1193142 RepID=UPI00217E6F33|nr:hypothetical protein [Roseibacterium beibuensis]
MANAVRIAEGREGWRGRGIADPAGLRLTRNAVMREALGGRTWSGAVTNRTGRGLVDVIVLVRILDGEGRPVGAPAIARASWFPPGIDLHLQARLPPAATGLRLSLLRWTVDGRTVETGPGDPRPFGAVDG